MLCNYVCAFGHTLSFTGVYKIFMHKFDSQSSGENKLIKAEVTVENFMRRLRRLANSSAPTPTEHLRFTESSEWRNSPCE